ncbi:enoyl-CoA hydratase/isomerase family protein [Desulfatiglans anilini]|uniref:enoyl-CoA hydratase/isomerase family protein n=1 Tax=Desulfatiglans anilini TaxID=90728 RepID=UPI000404FD7A|nr:enoyl-CoA hydratase/isomerase family protein [Desulfatiglans anilini]
MLIKDTHGNVAILKIDRPRQANALNAELFELLSNKLKELQDDERIRVVIITGAGEKAFCAGIDLKERANKNFDEMLLERETIIRAFYQTLGYFTKPTIAALNGPALGGGAELALTCDLRVATPMASFGQTEIKWGMIPSCGGCQRLRLIVGMGKAKEIILTGRVLEAGEAYRLGIYNKIVRIEDLTKEAIRLAREIAGNPIVAVKQAKKVLDFGAYINSALDFDFEASKECFSKGDAQKIAKKF